MCCDSVSARVLARLRFCWNAIVFAFCWHACDVVKMRLNTSWRDCEGTAGENGAGEGEEFGSGRGGRCQSGLYEYRVSAGRDAWRDKRERVGFGEIDELGLGISRKEVGGDRVGQAVKCDGAWRDRETIDENLHLERGCLTRGGRHNGRAGCVAVALDQQDGGLG